MDEISQWFLALFIVLTFIIVSHLLHALDEATIRIARLERHHPDIMRERNGS